MEWSWWIENIQNYLEYLGRRFPSMVLQCLDWSCGPRFLVKESAGLTWVEIGCKEMYPCWIYSTMLKCLMLTCLRRFVGLLELPIAIMAALSSKIGVGLFKL